MAAEAASKDQLNFARVYDAMRTNVRFRCDYVVVYLSPTAEDAVPFHRARLKRTETFSVHPRVLTRLREKQIGVRRRDRSFLEK